MQEFMMYSREVRYFCSFSVAVKSKMYISSFYFGVSGVKFLGLSPNQPQWHNQAGSFVEFGLLQSPRGYYVTVSWVQTEKGSCFEKMFFQKTYNSS